MITENEIRRTSIGGSDVLRLMDGDWNPLWMEKLGYKEPDDLSDVFPVQLGIFTEPFNVRMFARDMQVEVQEQVRYNCMLGEVPCRATLDGEFMYRGERVGLECKHTSESNTMSKQLERYMPQLQFYMYVSGFSYMYFANIFGNRRYEYVKVARNEEFIQALHPHIKEFWNLVVTETPPPTAFPSLHVPTSMVEINDMVARDATGDNEFMHYADTYIETKQAAKTHANATKQLKAMVATNEREVYTDRLQIKRDKRGALRINVLEK